MPAELSPSVHASRVSPSAYRRTLIKGVSECPGQSVRDESAGGKERENQRMSMRNLCLEFLWLDHNKYKRERGDGERGDGERIKECV